MRLVDVRIPRDELDRAMDTVRADRTLELRTITFNVPASGPEMELTFEGHEPSVLNSLSLRGISVLASRTRINTETPWV